MLDVVARFELIDQFLALLLVFLGYLVLNVREPSLQIVDVFFLDLALTHYGVEWVSHLVGDGRVDQGEVLFLCLDVVVEDVG